MPGMLRSRLTYANVASTIALFSALGGVGYASGLVGTKDIRNGAITNAKLARNAVTATKVRIGSLRLADITPRDLIGTSRLAVGAVTASQLADASVNAQKLADASVNTQKLVAGSVTPDRLGTVIAATAKRSTTMMIPGTATVDIPFESVVFDTGGITNLQSNNTTFVAPRTGVYTITGWIETSGSGQRRVLQINRIDGSTTTGLAFGESGPTGAASLANATAVTRLTTGEGIRFAVYNSGAGSISLGVGDDMFFSMIYNGPA